VKWGDTGLRCAWTTRVTGVFFSEKEIQIVDQRLSEENVKRQMLSVQGASGLNNLKDENVASWILAVDRKQTNKNSLAFESETLTRIVS